MATIQTLLDRERTLANVNDSQYTDTSALLDINTAYNYINRKIAKNIPSYFYDTWKSATVIWQSEYTAEELLWTPNVRIKKVNKVFCKYKATDTYPTRLIEKAPSDLVEHNSYYEDSANVSTPFFVERDNSIFIYPAPEEVVTNWVEIDCIYTPVDLALTDDIEKIKFPAEYNAIFFKWIRENIFLTLEDENRAEKARWIFQREVKSMISELTKFKIKSIQKKAVDLSNYK